MKNTSLVFLTIIIVLLFSFTFSFYFLFTTQNILAVTQTFFYSHIDEHKDSKIFLVGSSHFMPLNPEHMEAHIFEDETYSIFNLAESGDKPNTRIRQLDSIIAADPDLIIYGLNYRDFSENFGTDFFLPGPKELIHQNIPFDIPPFVDNPKLGTLSVIRDFFKIETPGNYGIKTPFFKIDEYLFPIVSNNQLNKIVGSDIYIPIKEKNKQFQNFKSMMVKFKENDLKVVVIITPIRESSVDKISQINKDNFDLIVATIALSLNISVYSLMENYEDEEIWRNTNHITNDVPGLIFSEDVAKIILKEI
jgi:hypothetical protein|tara:strand:+ start:199 stop:1116 length:918 start_codon:yes stop_codon:yes gene_type:complete